IGSINLDFVATAATLPAPGETVINARIARHPGGKGANQALAARRLGAEVTLVGRVGADPFADEALSLLKAEGVDLSQVVVDAIGAGDAFVAALALALAEGQPPEKALAFACAVGALACTRPGAQPALPDRAEVEALLAR